MSYFDPFCILYLSNDTFLFVLFVAHMSVHYILSMRISLIAFAGLLCSLQGCGDDKPDDSSNPPKLSSQGNTQFGYANGIPQGSFGGLNGMGGNNQVSPPKGKRGAAPFGGNLFGGMGDMDEMINELAADDSIPADVKVALMDLMVVLPQVNLERLQVLSQAALQGIIAGNTTPVRAFVESADWRRLKPFVGKLLKYVLNNDEVVASIKNDLDAETRALISLGFQAIKRNTVMYGLVLDIIGRDNFNRIEQILTRP